MGEWGGLVGGAYLTALYHRGQQTHVKLWPGRADVVLSSHQFDVLSAGKVWTQRHCTNKWIHEENQLKTLNINLNIKYLTEEEGSKKKDKEEEEESHWGCCCDGTCSGCAAGREPVCAGSREDSAEPAPSKRLQKIQNQQGTTVLLHHPSCYSYPNPANISHQRRTKTWLALTHYIEY